MRARRVPVDVVQARISKLALALTDAELDAGEDWWRQADYDIKEIVNETGHDYGRIAAALAILSPVKTWEETVSMVHTLAKDKYTRQRHWSKAWSKARVCIWVTKTLQGPYPFEYLVSGPKVLPFYKALMGNTNSVTVDRHMIRSVYPTDTQTKHRILTVTDAVRHSAAWDLQGQISPRDLQAAIWLKIRGD